MNLGLWIEGLWISVAVLVRSIRHTSRLTVLLFLTHLVPRRDCGVRLSRSARKLRAVRHFPATASRAPDLMSGHSPEVSTTSSTSRQLPPAPLPYARRIRPAIETGRPHGNWMTYPYQTAQAGESRNRLSHRVELFAQTSALERQIPAFGSAGPQPSPASRERTFRIHASAAAWPPG
jgi:hypothetical protein